MKNKRILCTKIANHLIKKYDINVFPNHMASEIILVLNKFDDEQETSLVGGLPAPSKE